MADQTPVGLLRQAHIVDYDVVRGQLTVELDFTNQSAPNDAKTKRIQFPFSYYSTDTQNNGLFIGGLPKRGTPVIIGQGEGSQWYFVGFKVNNVPTIPTLTLGQMLIQASDSSKMLMDIDGNIFIGSDTTYSYINTDSNKFVNKKQDVFSNTFSFTEAGRHINGIVKRETKQDNFTPASQKLTSKAYDDRLIPISFDPTATTLISSKSKNKNPPFVEHRDVVYEFAQASNVQDDITESKIYNGINTQDTVFNYPNRRQSKADLLSLSLVAPNYLMETIKGTVVDIFGNVLDINRTPIPIGKTPEVSLKPDSSVSTKDDVYSAIRALERKSVAYHFEMNARKDLTAQGGQAVLPDINSRDDYSRARSRFFLDIDKEGQFKLNVPASSETGNIPLLTRYENYSTFGTDDNGNPNKLVYRDDNLDIFLDSFALDGGDIDINDSGKSVTPIDRILNQHIKHGTPYHSITNSAFTFQTAFAQQFLANSQLNPTVDITTIPTIDNIVSSTINISGPNANAGGRSGTISMDGSIEVSVGANTVDRQSIWLDTAGGIIGNIGRDKNFVSGALSLDGDLLIQIGGSGVSNDSRFATINNAWRGGALDIRVVDQGFKTSVIRIDGNGITIISPSSINLHGREIRITAEGTLLLEGDNVAINERAVNRFPAVSI